MIIGLVLQSYYSIQHVQAAAYFARRAFDIEAALSNETAPEAMVLKAYVSGALFSSVAFLEALANELYADAMRPDGGHLSTIEESQRLAITRMDESHFTKKTPLFSKFDHFLLAAGKAPMPRGQDPSQAVATIIELRNAIIHCKASFFDSGSPHMVRSGNFHESSLPERIKGRFEMRKGATALSGDHWLGHGLARWSVESTVAYADAFFACIGVSPYFGHVRDQLGTSGTSA
jgi:hypothetical protein